MTARRLALLLIVCAACKPAPKPAKSAAAVPQMRATVVTIRSIAQPAKQTTTHTIVIANGLARSTDELDSWRLFDVKKKTVTFVDDIGKTFRTEPFRASRPAMPELPAHIPRASWTATGQRRAMLGTTAEEMVVSAGAYRRQLWIARHDAIPEDLFAMMQLSNPPTSQLAPMMQAVERAIAATRGFPLVDHAELPYGNSKMVIERAVLGIAQKDVARSLLEIPRGYRDLTPKPKAPKGR